MARDRPQLGVRVAQATVRSYLGALVGTFVVRLLRPWFENLGNRLVGSTKISIRDAGLLHSLLVLETLPDEVWRPVATSDCHSAEQASNASVAREGGLGELGPHRYQCI